MLQWRVDEVHSKAAARVRVRVESVCCSHQQYCGVSHAHLESVLLNARVGGEMTSRVWAEWQQQNHPLSSSCSHHCTTILISLRVREYLMVYWNDTTLKGRVLLVYENKRQTVCLSGRDFCRGLSRVASRVILHPTPHTTTTSHHSLTIQQFCTGATDHARFHTRRPE